MRIRLFAACAIAACGGTYGARAPQAPSPSSPSRAAASTASIAYAILDARTGHAVDTAAFWKTLAGERAICVGEEHSNPIDHRVELEVATHLFPQWHTGALGLEMIQRPFQGVLDDFAAGRIDATALQARVGWDERWGFDFGFYAPTIAAALAAHAALLALDASTELTKAVAHHGLANLSADDRARLPELDLANARHRAWFDALMADMGGGSGAHGSGDGGPSADDIYAVQVIWDETMADTAATWLAAHPDGHVIILAGSGHCHDTAIVGRMLRRGISGVVSLRIAGQDDISDALVKPINDYVIAVSGSASAAPSPASGHSRP